MHSTVGTTRAVLCTHDPEQVNSPRSTIQACCIVFPPAELIRWPLAQACIATSAFWVFRIEWRLALGLWLSESHPSPPRMVAGSQAYFSARQEQVLGTATLCRNNQCLDNRLMLTQIIVTTVFIDQRARNE